ncbi:MAG: hypothetical protein ACR2OM_04850, partial [Aestuariivirgaceae bacterium]
LLALMLVLAIAVICRSRAAGDPAVVFRLFLISAAVCLLSPSMFPWYFLWVLPFLCFYRVRGLLLLGVLMPFHYLYFHFAARDLEDIYNQGMVWLIWLPVWTVLAYDTGRALAGRRPSGLIDHAART